MDIVETRRENLRRWVAKNGTPAKEKSLFSQLKGLGSFGEKVARRLEAKYGMGAGYLDAVDAPVPQKDSVALGDERQRDYEKAMGLARLTIIYDELPPDFQKALVVHAEDLRMQDENRKGDARAPAQVAARYQGGAR